MKIYRNSLCENFKCLMGDCPFTCCHGWQIPVDPDFIGRYKRGGNPAIKLLFALGSRDGIPVLNPAAGNCYFYDKKDGLCSLQKEKGEEYIPEICKRFPRKYKNYGPFCEESLELACPGAALLFVEDHDRLATLTPEGEVSYPCTATNDDYDYLDQLVQSRESIISYLNAPGHVALKLRTLFSYGKALQQHCVEVSTGVMPGDACAIRLNDFSPADYEESHPASDCFPLYDLATTDRLMCSGIYSTALKRRIPLLYEVCSLYYKTFDALPMDQGNQKLTELLEDFAANEPDRMALFKHYYQYYLISNYLNCFEDYSFLRCFVMGALHLHFVALFFALYEKEHGALSKKDMANLIAAYEKHVRHNDALLDELWAEVPKL